MLPLEFSNQEQKTLLLARLPILMVIFLLRLLKEHTILDLNTFLTNLKP